MQRPGEDMAMASLAYFHCFVVYLEPALVQWVVLLAMWKEQGGWGLTAVFSEG